MNVAVRNFTEEEAQGIVAIADPVPRDRVGSRKTTGCGSSQGSVSLTAPLYGRAGVATSPPLRTLGHLIGRSARSDLGADEKGITSEKVQRRKVAIMPRLISRTGGTGDDRRVAEAESL